METARNDRLTVSGIRRGRVYRWRWSQNGWKPAAWKASGKVARRELAAVESHFFEQYIVNNIKRNEFFS
ncbi:hypothetical protein LXL04_001407 [Taraxacum kok-saghyz]